MVMRLILVLLLSLVALGLSVTPVEKVVTLLEDLKAQVEGEGAAEAKAYEEYACFCKDTTGTKSSSITSGQDNIDLASADIEEKTAKKAETISELTSRQATQEELSAELESTTVRCASEKAAYEAKNADLTKAISSLESAIKALSDAKPTSFLALRKSVQQTLAMADALAMLKRPKQQAVMKLLQSKASVDPLDPTYQYHSDGILGTVNELLEEFQDEKKVTDDEWAKTNQACIDTKASLTGKMKENADAIKACGEQIEKLKSEIAETREDLVNYEGLLKDDQVYLKDLTAQCEARAKDFDQRSKLRGDELTALSQALTIMQTTVSTQDQAVNKRALVQERGAPRQQPARAGVPSFLQLHRGVASQAGKREAVAAGSATASELKVTRVTELLVGESRRLHSIVLSTMAARVRGDPFAKVKTLIQQLVERLLKEATAEATKKGFCDTELGKAQQDRDFRWTDMQKKSVELAGLEAKKDKLSAEIESLTGSLAELRTDLANATSMRAAEKELNIDTVGKAKEGLAAVTEAIAVLKTFYKQAAKAKVLLQASPVDEDTTGPGFDTAYKGNQEKSAGIIGMLEVIKSDFERTIKTTEASEKTAAADFVEFDRASNTDISGQDTKKTLNSEDLETTNSNIEQATMDLQTATDLLDAALKTIEDLKPTCIDMTMPYEERVAKREEEMAALKKALCILDTEGVEADCQP